MLVQQSRPHKQAVSILILLEIALEAGYTHLSKGDRLPVSILILLEIALEALEVRLPF